MKAPFFEKLKRALHQGKDDAEGLDRGHLLSNEQRETYIVLEGKRYKVVNLGKAVAPLLRHE